ncbi:BrnA antitoxin family protein [Bradyrhizobium sp.]|uniref:BrnA antitoxin family protein n=1 Tax=Bradyrhizobium sp. TaxID=376 RepID=UPI002DFF7F7E|nr:BrnA antitoxin family protein [Bradyrhizobium sp.]
MVFSYDLPGPNKGVAAAVVSLIWILAALGIHLLARALHGVCVVCDTVGRAACVLRPVSVGPDAELRRCDDLKHAPSEQPGWAKSKTPNGPPRILRPASEMPEAMLAQFKNGRGRPKLAFPKEGVKIRLDAEVVSALRASGKGWQTAINDLLRSRLKNGKIALGRRKAKESRRGG